MRRKTLEQFIEEAKQVHGDKYDYSKFKYINTDTKSEVICKKHGIFSIDPYHHINRKQGCKKCGYDKLSKEKIKNTNQFIKEAKQIHGDKYDYSLVDYKGEHSKIKIKCNKCKKIFIQTPHNHIHNKYNNGCGCPYCFGLYKTTEQFIEEAKQVHGDKYDYSLVDYKNARKKIKIKCNKCKKIFEQAPFNHLNGCGCPFCKSSKGEEKIRKLLEEYGYVYKKTFFVEKSFRFLKDRGHLRFDFYIPDKKIAIEYQGKQHYQVVDKWGGEEGLKLRQKHDQMKRDYCLKNNITLIEINYRENIKEKLNEVFRVKEEIIT